MTYCAGWKHQGAVYLLADAVAATSMAPLREQVSLGAMRTDHRRDPVEEGSLRLVRIAPGTMVACVGDPELAKRILDGLREGRRLGRSNLDLLSAADGLIGSVDADRSVELLLAASSDDGSTELLHWTTADGLDRGEADYFQIGDSTPYRAALSPEIRSILAAGDLTSDRLLPVVTAIVQSHGVRDAAIDIGVDGLIFGLRTEGGRVTWQQDTLVVFYDQAFASSHHVAVLARDDELIVHTSDNDVTRWFASSLAVPYRRSRSAAWWREVRGDLAADRFRYRVFVSTSERAITMIIRNDVERESRYLRLRAQGDGQFDYAFSPEMTSLLLRPLQDRSHGGIPLQLSVRED